MKLETEDKYAKRNTFVEYLNWRSKKNGVAADQS